MAQTTYLLLGSNLGDRFATINTALEKIEEQAGSILQRSGYYETEPWGFAHNNSFINMVVKLKTKLPPKELLATLLGIEKEMGRTRKEGIVDARNIDIDVLLYDNFIIDEPEITIPHPRMHLRKFTLIPLVEIAPELVHPRLKVGFLELLNHCKDTLKVVQVPPKG